MFDQYNIDHGDFHSHTTAILAAKKMKKTMVPRCLGISSDRSVYLKAFLKC